MIERIKTLRSSRRPIPHKKPDCPICKVQMKRKGKKGKSDYYKCPKCKGKTRGGLFFEAHNPETLDIRNHQIKEFRKELSKRKLVIRLQKEKYFPFESFEWGGQIVNLNDYDKDGISFEEKRKMEEEHKKQEEAVKKAEKKKKRIKKKGEDKLV